MAKILNASIDVTLGGENASNEAISSQKAIKTYVDNSTGDLSSLTTTSKTNLVSAINEVLDDISNLSYSTDSPALTPVLGVCTWQITHNLGTQDIICGLYASGVEVVKDVLINSDNAITITFNSSESLSTGALKAVIFASGGVVSSGGGGSYTLPVATTSTLGGVKIDGTSITINGEGVISSVSDTYTLPVATTSTLGGVKIDGTSITINNDGVISSTGGTPITIDSTLSTTSTNPVQNSVITTTLNGKLDTNASNLTTTGQKVFDGQIVDLYDVTGSSYNTIASGVSYNPSGEAVSYSIASLLPNDSYKYEVFFRFISETSVAGHVGTPVRTDIFMTHSYLNCAYIYNLSAVTNYKYEHIWLPVGAGRTITVVPVGWLSASKYNIEVIAYRRIGTNS